MKKVVSILFIGMLIIFNTLFAGDSYIGTGCMANHSISTHDNGTVYTWGRNIEGQLGDNSTTQRNTPVAIYTSGVLSGKTITAVAAGYYHSLALASDGTVYAWGDNAQGQLGDNNYPTDSDVPVAVDMSGVLSGKTITAVAAGMYHSLVLASDGTVYSWGLNSEGGLGDNSTVRRNAPVAVDTSGVLSGKTITAIAAGMYHSIALASDGNVYTWGDNNYGQLGNNFTADTDVPVAVYTSGVLSDKTITAIAGGGYFSLALDSDGAVYAWGYNFYGQLGDNSTTQRKIPVAVYNSGVLSGKTISAIAAGRNHSLAMDSDATLYSWGNNANGQLGDNNSPTVSDVPVTVDMSGVLSGKTITTIAAGMYHSLVLASDGTVYSWGDNVYGQLGDNNNPTDSDVPVQVINSDNSDFVLPIELESFTADYSKGAVNISWKSATETDNAHFLIYRNDDVIASIEGAGTSSEPHNYTYTDNTLIPGESYAYMLADVSYANVETKYSNKVVTIVIPENDIPQELSLEANYPNPFNPKTVIRLHYAENCNSVINIYDVQGILVEQLFNGPIEAGSYELTWNAADMPSGVYIVRMTAGDFVASQKVVLIK